MKRNAREYRAERAGLLDEMTAMIDKADKQNRVFTSTEEREWDAKVKRCETLLQEAELLESSSGMSFDRFGEAVFSQRGGPMRDQARAINPDEARAIQHFIRTGESGPMIEMRAKDETMVEATAADGGAAVPTGLYNQIVARRNETLLSAKLGCRPITGQGLTVNVVYDNAAPNDFALTSEQIDNHANVFQRDAPTLGTKAFTFLKYTKKIELTDELIYDEAANLMQFISDHVGRAVASTHNALLLTEVAANGTSFKTFAAAAAIAAGEPEDIAINDTVAPYLSDGPETAFVMRPSTLNMIGSITGNPRLYAETPAGSFRERLMGYPVATSVKAAAVAASAKSIYWGNWSFVGVREGPGMIMLRDPFSVDGAIVLKFYFRAVYGVLQAGAIGYAVHPSA